jgi:hypothetical protein
LNMFALGTPSLTPKDREIKQRVSAHQAEVVREAKKLVRSAKPNPTKKKMPGREDRTKPAEACTLISRQIRSPRPSGRDHRTPLGQRVATRYRLQFS